MTKERRVLFQSRNSRYHDMTESEHPEETSICILVVENDADIAGATCQALSQAGYSVTRVSTGWEVLQTLRDKHVDLVLLDRDLSDMNGLDVCRQIKSDPALTDIFVVVASASQKSEQSQIEGLTLGADGYVARPISNCELVARVEAFVRILRLNRALRSQAELLQAKFEELQTEVIERRKAEAQAKSAQVETAHLLELAEQSRRALLSAAEDQQVATAALRESEARFRVLVEQAGDGFELLDEEGHFLDMNRATCLQLGYTREELLGTEVSKINPVISWEEFLERLSVLEQKPTTFETVHKRKDGSTFPVEITSSMIRMGDTRRLISLVRDITGRKRVEEVLTFLATSSSADSSEPFFNLLARFLAQSLGMDFVCINRLIGDGLSVRTVAVWCDGHFEDNATYVLKDTPCGKAVTETICCFPASVRQLFPRDKMLRDLRAEGYVGVTLRNHSGQPIGLIALISRNPLTNRSHAEATLKLVAIRAAGEMERQQAEDALRESEERYQALFMRSMDAIYLLDFEGRFLDANPAALKMMGYSRDDIRKLNIAAVLASEEQIPQALAAIQEVIATGANAKSMDYNLRRKDGNVLCVMNLATLVYHDGKPLAILGIAHDITTRKQSEEALRESEFFFKESQRAGSIGSYTTDFITGFWESSEVLDQIYGIDKSYNRSVQGWLDIVHPDDRVTLDHYVREEFLSKRRPFNKEYRIVRKSDGKTRWVLGLGSVGLDPEGRVVSMIGTIQDITERKETEEQLKKKMHDLERFNAITVDRELRMVELKKEVNALLKKAGEKPQYRVEP